MFKIDKFNFAGQYFKIKSEYKNLSPVEFGKTMRQNLEMLEKSFISSKNLEAEITDSFSKLSFTVKSKGTDSVKGKSKA